MGSLPMAASSDACLSAEALSARSILPPASAVYSRFEPLMRLPVASYFVLEQSPKNDFVVYIRLSLARSFDIARLLNLAILLLLLISGLLCLFPYGHRQ